MALVTGVAALFFFSGYFNSVPWPSLGIAVLHTTYRLIVAYFIALLLGVSIAIIVSWTPFFDALFSIFDVLQNIPSFALIPFFFYFFGVTDEMVILLAASCIVWPILFAILGSIKNTRQDLNDAATIFGARGLRRVPYYLVPLFYPSMLTGSMVGIASGWEAVIGVEIITSITGFGSFIKDASVSGINQSAVAGMLVILIIVFIINRLVWAPLLAESSRRYAE
jgi:ABC-type nitrate/sulfonate/bicarbonate transport system permease component